MTSKDRLLSGLRRQLRTTGQASILFVIIALFFGLIIIKEVPPFWALDESAHFSRAYQISQGQFLPQKLADGNYGGTVPASLVELDSVAHQDLTSLDPQPVTNRHDLRHQSLQQAVEGQSLDQSNKVIFHFPGSAVYTPIAYAAPATGILMCRIADCSLDQAVLVARAFSLLSYTAVVAFAIWLLRTKKIKWLIFAVGLLPMTIFQAAAVSADGPILALSLLLFAVVVKAFSEKKLSPFLLTLLGLIAICLPLIKISYGFLDLSLIPVALIVFKDKRKALLYAGACIGLAAILTLLWLYLAHGPAKMIGTLKAPDSTTHTFVNVKQQGQFLLHQPFEFVRVVAKTVVYTEPYLVITTTGEFGLNAIQLPLSATVYSYIIIVCSVFYARIELARYKKPVIILALLAILTALSIFGILYLTFTPVRASMVAGVQGRYFTPLIPFFMAAIGALIPIRVSMSPRTTSLLFSLSSCALLLAAISYYGLATY